MKKYYCKEKNCNNEVCKETYLYGDGRCYFCANKGIRNRRYIDNRTNKKYYCIDCGTEISMCSGFYGQSRCKSCGQTQRTKYLRGKQHTDETKKKIRQKTILALKNRKHNLNLNNVEKELNTLLQQLLPNEYKFVGNFKFWIHGFNPDFINCNGQKKIIELFGDYWHNLPSYRERDKRRLIAYNREGYKTLIIWQHELKDMNKMQNKIKEFHYGSL